MGIKYTAEDIGHIAKKEYGLTLLSDSYHRNTDPLAWKQDSTDMIFQKSWKNIQKNPKPQTKLDTYTAVKRFIEGYKRLGYEYRQTEEEYLHAEILQGKNRVYVISHPELHEDWITSLSNFKRDALTRLNKTGRSTGELLVEATLRENGLDYKRQYRVNIEGQLHIFDFMLPAFSLYIEYDGEQHFRESSGYYSGKLGKQVRKDKVKDDYAESIGYTVLRIPYTNDTLSGVTRTLSEYLDIPLVVGRYTPKNFQQDVYEYYNTHNLVDTASHFGIHTTTVTSTYKLVAGKTKREVMRETK